MIHSIASLFRIRLSLLNGISSLAGYLLFPAPVESLPFTVAFTAVFLLAAGGSSVNQLMERDLDARMERTRLRPVVQKTLSPATASALGAGTILPGLLLLFIVGGAKAALPGVVALLWYLLVYTPLKTRTSLALPVGALCGAFTPLIGWCLAGGNLYDYRIIFLAGLFFLWQVPHFWLLQRRHAEEYRQAGIPLVTMQGNFGSNRPFFWLWMAALCAGAMLLPAFGIIKRPGANWYMFFPAPIIFFSIYRSGRLLFPCVNCFPLLVTLLLAIQKYHE